MKKIPKNSNQIQLRRHENTTHPQPKTILKEIKTSTTIRKKLSDANIIHIHANKKKTRKEKQNKIKIIYTNANGITGKINIVRTPREENIIFYYTSDGNTLF